MGEALRMPRRDFLHLSKAAIVVGLTGGGLVATGVAAERYFDKEKELASPVLTLPEIKPAQEITPIQGSLLQGEKGDYIREKHSRLLHTQGQLKETLGMISDQQGTNPLKYTFNSETEIVLFATLGKMTHMQNITPSYAIEIREAVERNGVMSVTPFEKKIENYTGGVPEMREISPYVLATFPRVRVGDKELPYTVEEFVKDVGIHNFRGR